MSPTTILNALFRIAIVCKVAFEDGLAGIRQPATYGALERLVEDSMYAPQYQPLIYTQGR